MIDFIKVIQVVGEQWQFLIVVFVIIVFLFNLKRIGHFFNSVSELKLKKGDSEVSLSKIFNNSIDQNKGIDNSNLRMEKNEVKCISKTEASKIFLEKLADPNIKNIKIITYTNEVEAGQMNKYKIFGDKVIEIFKRSLFADLYEQQKTNIERLQLVDEFKAWNKSKIIINSTKQLEEAFKNDPNIKLEQYFYDNPPTKRAYIFDDTEAIYNYYQCSLVTDGSRYKGMGDLDRLYITSDTQLGKYLIKELLNEVKLLKIHSRSLHLENNLIDNNKEFFYPHLSTPIIELKGVLIDMDGVLYDSMWQYKIAWKEAFMAKGITISDYDVYMNEGRSGSETIKLLYKKYNFGKPTDKDIYDIKSKRNSVLKTLGNPKPQEGIFDFLYQLKKSNLEIYVVTGSSRESIKEAIVNDFSEYIKMENIITGLDVKIGKPSPEPYLIALHKANLKQTEALIIENAPLGVESAKRSGVYTIAVNTGVLDKKELLSAGADNIFNSCTELSNYWERIFQFLKI